MRFYLSTKTIFLPITSMMAMTKWILGLDRQLSDLKNALAHFDSTVNELGVACKPDMPLTLRRVNFNSLMTGSQFVSFDASVTMTCVRFRYRVLFLSNGTPKEQ